MAQKKKKQFRGMAKKKKEKNGNPFQSASGSNHQTTVALSFIFSHSQSQGISINTVRDFSFFLELSLVALPLGVEMDSTLETILSDSGVDPALSTALVTDGWTSQSFREVVANVSDFTRSAF